jgi:hypothetical protein
MGDEQNTTEEKLTFWQEHRFLLLIAIVIAIALVLLSISMALYNSSGAVQLDLSRPGYRAVTSQAVSTDTDFQTYPNTGPIDRASTNEFKKLYEDQATKAKAVDAFAGDPLNPDSLEISAPPVQ